MTFEEYKILQGDFRKITLTTDQVDGLKKIEIERKEIRDRILEKEKKAEEMKQAKRQEKLADYPRWLRMVVNNPDFFLDKKKKQ